MNIKDLSFGARKRLVSWCKAHDWASDTAYIQGHGVGMRIVVMGNDQTHEFYSVNDLHDWAGY